MTQLVQFYSVDELAGAFGVSSSGFQAHRHKAERPRALKNRLLAGQIKTLFKANRKVYGSPRICQALRKQGWGCSKNRVARLMRVEQLRAKQKRRWKPCTTQSAHRRPLAPNLLARNAVAKRPNQIWQSDITYLPTAQGWVYLAVTLDACSRRVLGWELDDSLETPLVTRALEKARRGRSLTPGLLHHSDRGAQYASDSFVQLLHLNNITQSMSRPANCYDNALAESFFATLKTECFGSQIPQDKTSCRTMVFDYIETFYNPRRLHSSLGYKTPVEFEKQWC